MSLNTAHINGGVLIHAGECILLFSEDVSMEFSGQDNPTFKGTKTGRLYLTTHRMIFNNNKQTDPMLSFSFPFITLSDVELEQPVFSANYIKGKVRAQPNGNWVGEAKFKLLFKKGGAVEYAQAMLKAASMASRNGPNTAPPPYTPPGQWYQAPPPAYAPNPTGYYGWVPPHNAFPAQPPPNSVYMTDMPPPYPGINMPMGGYGAPPPQAPGYNAPMGMGGYGAPQPQATGFAASAPTSADAKAAEAAQSAYYDPNRQQNAFAAPPAYYEPPPSYDEASKKNQ